MVENEQATREGEPQARSPATIALCLAWVAVYLAMAWQQGSLHAKGKNVISGGIETTVTDRFGSVTAAQLQSGQDWRALTATFIHLSLFHLGFNLLMLFQLGRLIEPWYGSGLFLAVYVVIGWAGNIVSAFAKSAYYRFFPRTDGQPWDFPSAGGSGVLCGLVALVAVVGWRSRTRFGEYIRAQMVGMLVFIAALGLLIPKVDNFTHACGALVGAGVGFAHRRLIRFAHTIGARVIGVIALAAILLCAAAQANLELSRQRATQLQKAIVERQQARREIVAIDRLYREQMLEVEWNHQPFHYPSRVQSQHRTLLAQALDRLEALETRLDDGPSGANYRRYLALARLATRRRPLPGEIRLFFSDELQLDRQIRQDDLRDGEQIVSLARELGMVKGVAKAPAPAPKAGASPLKPSGG